MPVAFTPLNILSGFKKCGIQPLNPGEVSDRSLAPSKAVSVQPSVSKCSSSSVVFTPEQEALYEKRYEEGYDLDTDPDYVAWLNINYPSSASSKSPSVNLSTGNSSVPSLSLTAVSNPSVTPPSTVSSSVTSSDVLDELLVLPEPQRPKTSRRKKQAINSKAVCITDDEVLDDMKKNEKRKEKER